MMSIRNLMLAGGLALALAGCEDGTKDKTIEDLTKENQTLRRELEDAKAKIPSPRPKYKLPDDCEQAIKYETVRLGEPFVINGIFAGDVTPAVGVFYRHRQTEATEWTFDGFPMTGGKIEKSYGQRPGTNHAYHRYTVGDTTYIFFFKDLADGSIKVASSPEACMGAIDLTKLYPKEDLERFSVPK